VKSKWNETTTQITQVIQRAAKDDDMANYPLALSQSDIAQKLKFLTVRHSMFARLFDAMMASRQRRVDREIARYLAATGSCGRLTDSIEREIDHRFLSNRSRW